MSTEIKSSDGVITPEFYDWLRRRDDVATDFYALDLDINKWIDACNRVSGEQYGIMSHSTGTTIRSTISFNTRLRVGIVISALRLIGHDVFANRLSLLICDPKDIKLREYLGARGRLRIQLQTLLSGCWEQLFAQYALLDPVRFNGEHLMTIKAHHNNELERCGDFIRFISENYRVADTLQDLFTCLVGAGQISVLEKFAPYVSMPVAPPTQHHLMCLRCNMNRVDAIRSPCYHAAECMTCQVNPKCVKCDVASGYAVPIRQ